MHIEEQKVVLRIERGNCRPLYWRVHLRSDKLEGHTSVKCNIAIRRSEVALAVDVYVSRNVLVRWQSHQSACVLMGWQQKVSLIKVARVGTGLSLLWTSSSTDLFATFKWATRTVCCRFAKLLLDFCHSTAFGFSEVFGILKYSFHKFQVIFLFILISRLSLSEEEG